MRITLLVTLFVAIAAPAARADIRVEGDLGGAVPVTSLIDHRGTEFENGPGVEARATALFGPLAVGYGFTQLGNNRVCYSGCVDGGFGSTRIHALTVGARVGFGSSSWRPFAELGVGGVIVQPGAWPFDGARETIFGGTAFAAGGVELDLRDDLYVAVSARYRFVATNNGAGSDSTQDAIDVAFLGIDDPGGQASDHVHDLHAIDITTGVGARF